MKTPTPKFKGTVLADKTLKMFDLERRNMARWIATFPAGAELEITIRKRSEKRSNLQNSYYWGVVLPILADHIGHDTVEAMHEDLKLKFNPVPSKIHPEKKTGGSTAEMSTEKFTKYVDTVCRWAATDLGCYIPEPEDKK